MKQATIEAKKPRLRKDGREYRERGQGCLYRVEGSKNWIARFVDQRGAPVTRSTKTPIKARAEEVLQAWLRQKQDGTLQSRKQLQTTIADLMKLVIADYERKRWKSLQQLKTRWRIHLEPVFGGQYLASSLTTQDIDNYIKQRREHGGADATINRELSGLRRALKLGMKNRPPLVFAHQVPQIEMLREDNARQQFITPEQIERLQKECSCHLWLRTYLELALSIGWRRGELCAMRRSWFDPLENTLTLPASYSKNKKARVVALGPLAKALVLQCCLGKGPDDFILTHDKTKDRIGDMRRTWIKACCRAGVGRLVCKTCDGGKVVRASKHVHRCENCGKRKWKQIRYEGLIPHSLRRTFAKTMVASGVNEKVVMDIGGWKTRQMLDRYHIVNVDTMREAQVMLEMKRQRDREKVQASFDLSLLQVGPAPAPSGETAKLKD